MIKINGVELKAGDFISVGPENSIRIVTKISSSYTKGLFEVTFNEPVEGWSSWDYYSDGRFESSNSNEELQWAIHEILPRDLHPTNQQVGLRLVAE